VIGVCPRGWSHPTAPRPDIHAIRIEHPTDIRSGLSNALNHPGPALVDLSLTTPTHSRSAVSRAHETAPTLLVYTGALLMARTGMQPVVGPTVSHRKSFDTVLWVVESCRIVRLPHKSAILGAARVHSTNLSRCTRSKRGAVSCAREKLRGSRVRWGLVNEGRRGRGPGWFERIAKRLIGCRRVLDPDRVDVRTRSGRVRPPTAGRLRSILRISNTPEVRVGPNRGAEPPPRPGRWAGLEDRPRENRFLGIKAYAWPRLPHRYRRRALPGQALADFWKPSSRAARPQEQWWPVPTKKNVFQRQPLPDIGVPAPPMASPRTADFPHLSVIGRVQRTSELDPAVPRPRGRLV